MRHWLAPLTCLLNCLGPFALVYLGDFLILPAALAPLAAGLWGWARGERRENGP